MHHPILRQFSAGIEPLNLPFRCLFPEMDVTRLCLYLLGHSTQLIGRPIDQPESYLKFERYCAAQREHGVSRWAVEDLTGAFVGYAGVMPRL